jgi:hypothetical protein
MARLRCPMSRRLRRRLRAGTTAAQPLHRRDDGGVIVEWTFGGVHKCHWCSMVFHGVHGVHVCPCVIRALDLASAKFFLQSIRFSAVLSLTLLEHRR